MANKEPGFDSSQHLKPLVAGEESPKMATNTTHDSEHDSLATDHRPELDFAHAEVQTHVTNL